MKIAKKLVRLLWRSVYRLKQVFLSEEYEMLRYAMNELSELRALVRYLLPESENYQQFVEQTNASFDYQWKRLDRGKHLLTDDNFKAEAISTLEKYTGLSRSWFAGKKILDAGCGNGRWSWTLCQCGAEVIAVDQSIAAVATAREACKDFPAFQARQLNLLENIGMSEIFDMVWAYGVIHHTGNTRRAIWNIAECVKPGGYLFLMVYGVPRLDHPEDFVKINGYNLLRQELALMSFDERVAYLRQHKPEAEVHGWFDALSPRINDLHRFDEIAEWLYLLKFAEIRITVPSRNLHIIARRS